MAIRAPHPWHRHRKTVMKHYSCVDDCFPKIRMSTYSLGRRSIFSEADIHIDGLQWSEMYFGIAA